MKLIGCHSTKKDGRLYNPALKAYIAMNTFFPFMMEIPLGTGSDSVRPNRSRIMSSTTVCCS